VRRLLLVLFCSAVLLLARPRHSGPGDPRRPHRHPATQATYGHNRVQLRPTLLLSWRPQPRRARCSNQRRSRWRLGHARASRGRVHRQVPVMPTLTTQTATTAVGDARASLWTYEQGATLLLRAGHQLPDGLSGIRQPGDPL